MWECSTSSSVSQRSPPITRSRSLTRRKFLCDDTSGGARGKERERHKSNRSICEGILRLRHNLARFFLYRLDADAFTQVHPCLSACLFRHFCFWEWSTY